MVMLKWERLECEECGGQGGWMGSDNADVDICPGCMGRGYTERKQTVDTPRTVNRLREQAAALLAEADRIEDRRNRTQPVIDALERLDNYRAIRWHQRMNGRTYTYAGVKANGRWYITGRISTNLASAELVRRMLQDADPEFDPLQTIVTLAPERILIVQ